MKKSGLLLRHLKKQTMLLDHLIRKLEAKNRLADTDFRFYDQVTLQVEQNLRQLRKDFSNKNKIQ